MKHTRFLSLFLTLCLLLTACGASAPADQEAMAEAGYADTMNSVADYDLIVAETMSAAELKSDSAVPESPAAQSGRKLIKTVQIDAETEHYDDLTAALEAKITALGGYTESRRTGKRGSSRWSNMTLRIPADKLGDFMTHVEENANILSTAEDTRDVTLQYSDTEAKITALRTEQARLLELLAGAGSLSEILEVEARLSDVTYELERFESQKRSYDNQITYATVQLSLREVETLTPTQEPTVWQRIASGFTSSLQGVADGFVSALVLLIGGSPYWVLCGAGLALGLFLARKLRRKKQ